MNGEGDKSVSVLVANHDASRTGAPIVLLTFLRWLRAETDIEVELVLWRGGPLVDSFRQLASVHVLHPAPGERSAPEIAELGAERIGAPALSRLARSLRVRWRLRRLQSPDVVYFNGAGSGVLVPHRPQEPPAVAHVHELDDVFARCLSEPERIRYLRRAERVIAVSEAVATMLAQTHLVEERRVVVVNEFFDEARACMPSERALEDPPLVASVGTGSWRKGIDLFVQVAAEIRRRHAGPVRFAWIGRLDDEEAVRFELRARDLERCTTLTGEVSDVRPWYRCMSVFCSTAREDPFPVAVLEAAASGVPVVAFPSGGASEILDEGRGMTVPYGDVREMADAVLQVLAADEPEVGRLAEHVRSTHTAAAAAPLIVAQIEDLASRGEP